MPKLPFHPEAPLIMYKQTFDLYVNVGESEEAIMGHFKRHWGALMQGVREQGVSLDHFSLDFVFPAVQAAPALDEPYEIQNPTREKIIGISTDLFLLVLQLRRERPKHASIEQAIDVLSRQRQKEKQRPWSRSSFLEFWPKGRPYVAAYLAMRLYPDAHIDFLNLYRLPGENFVKVGETTSQAMKRIFANPDFAENLKNWDDTSTAMYLAHVRALHEEGTKHYSHGQEARDKPLISPEESWSVPDELDLPKIQIELPALTEEQLRWVDGLE